MSNFAHPASDRLDGIVLATGEAPLFRPGEPVRPRPDHPRPHPIFPQAPRAAYLAVRAAAKRRLPEGHADRALGPTDPVLYHPPEEA